MTSPVGRHRVTAPAGALPQAAWSLDPSPAVGRDEVRVALSRLHLDAASFRQLAGEHPDGDAVRQAVAATIAARGKMHNPVTGSGGMLLGTVDEVGPDSPLGLRPGDRVATLVSLTLTPLAVTDGLAGWDGRGPQVPCQGHAILFARSAAAVLPDDLEPALALAVLDVCGAPALTDRWVRRYAAGGDPPTVAVLGAAGTSGALTLAAARRAGARATVGLVPTREEADRLAAAGLAHTVVRADARDSVATADAVTGALGHGASLTVVCVDVPDAEHGAVLATADGGAVLFFSMATSFPAAALGAEGLAADVTLLIGNGYVPGHAEAALALVRDDPAVRALLTDRLPAD